ncbi:hypothetical protein BB559_001595 [Furculomyces boomerangus]|uniref:Adenylyl cyclase-associated protein n=2 Tax=Harpellales TaxID=61421 RepID=A0A2T9Z1P8_9FUNG|nr:hypothetical protein BB559_001595 [Furculomyces boomerangus]PWA01072.1 hypothetical protein BB558_002878 [Smittium angustum]
MLSELLQRLETATKKLEQLAQKKQTLQALPPTQVQPQSENVSSSPEFTPKEDRVAVEYRNTVGKVGENFKTLSQDVGSLVAQQGELVFKLLDEQTKFINVAIRLQKPNMADFQRLLQVQQKTMTSIIDIKEKNRASKQFNQLSVVSEGIGAFGWITVENTPMGFINDMKDSAQFYTNRVLKEFKDSDPKQIVWVKEFIQLLSTLHLYVKQNFTTGIKWGFIKPTITLDDALAQLNTDNPPATKADSEQQPVHTAPDTRGALFSELNKGAAITAGLKKVDKSKKVSSEVPAQPVKPKTKTLQSSAKTETKKQGRQVLDGKKWIVENMDNAEIEVDITDITQTLYVFNCNGSVIKVNNKLNALTMDKCSKTGLVFDSVVASCDLVNCKSVKIQATKTVPIINIDKTDGVQVFLSSEALDLVEILTAKSTEVNICYPDPNSKEEFDYKESFVPEQMRTVVVNGNIVTNVLEHSF